MFKYKKLFMIIIITAVAIYSIGIIRDRIIKSVINITATKILGTKVEMGKFCMSVFTQAVSIKNFKIYNPEGFNGGLMLDIPTIKVDIDVWALLKKQIHLQYLE